MNKKIKCPYCGILISAESKKCPFCGENVTKNEEKTAKSAPTASIVESKKSKKLELFVLFIFVACSLFVLNLIGMIFPACGNVSNSIYGMAFNPPTEDEITIGTNAAGIFFLFEVIGLLTSVAVLWCLWKQSKELRLFMTFTTFFVTVNALVSFLSPIIFGSGGVNASTFTMGIGFIITGILSLGAAGTMITALILHKKFLVENPSNL